MKESWKRLKGESSKIYSYFCFYRDLGNSRTIEKVAEKFSKSATIMNRYSSKYDWVKKSEAGKQIREKFQ